MDSVIVVDIPPACECARCMFYRRTKSGRSPRIATENIQDVKFVGETHCTSDGESCSSGLHTRNSDCSRIRKKTVNSGRNLGKPVKNFAWILLFYGVIILCVIVMGVLHNFAVDHTKFYVFVVVLPLGFISLPSFLCKIGVFDLCLSSSVERTEVSAPPDPTLMPAEKPPLYDSLVFTTSGSALSNLTPPSYDVAINAKDDFQCLPPMYSWDVNVEVPPCPVHQQSSTSQPVEVQDSNVQKSRELPVLDTILLV